MDRVDIGKLHRAIQNRFQSEGSEEKKIRVQYFFREPVKSYGVSATLAKTLASELVRTHKAFTPHDWFNLCDLLWTSGMHEEGLLASHLALRQRKHFQPSDFERFEEWVQTCISNWAQCDTFCNHSMAEFLKRYPEYIKNVIKWTESTNVWVQRASVVTFCVPASRGEFIPKALHISEKLLSSREEMVQKGVGWLLKSVTEFDPKITINFILKHHALPALIRRTAVEKLDSSDKEQLRIAR